MMAQVQEVAQLVADNGISTGTLIALTMGIGVALIAFVDRIFFLFKSWGIIKTNGKKINGQITQVQWSKLVDGTAALLAHMETNARKMDDLHEWHSVERPDMPGQKIWYMPWKELNDLLSRIGSALDKQEIVLDRLIFTLNKMESAAKARDVQLGEHRKLLEQIAQKVA